MKNQDLDAVQLAGGRALTYARFGRPGGRRLLYCQGLPGSALPYPDGGFWSATGFEVLVPARPGYGRSDRDPGRTLGSFGQDMLALLDDVGWADCSLVGYSVGGPFALAAAAALGERARRVALISSVGRADLGTSGPLKLLAGLAHRAPALIGQGYPPFERLLLRQAAVLRLAGLFSPSMDRTALGKGWVRAAIGNNGRLAFERGGAGALDDLLAISADWGQLTNEIDCAVRLWHGEDDHLVPPGPARALAGELSQGSFTLVPDAGHMMVFELAPVIANWLSRAL